MYAAESSSWGKVVLDNAARIAVAPSCGAGTDASEPLNWNIRQYVNRSIESSFETYDANGSTSRSNDVRFLYFLMDCSTRRKSAYSCGGETVAAQSESALSQKP